MPEGGLKVCEAGGKSIPEGGVKICEAGGKSNPIVEKEEEKLVKKKVEKYTPDDVVYLFKKFVNEVEKKHVFFEKQEDNDLFFRELTLFCKRVHEAIIYDLDDCLLKLAVKLKILEKIRPKLVAFFKKNNYDLYFFESNLEKYENYYAQLHSKKKPKDLYYQFLNCLKDNWAKYKKKNKNMSFLEEVKVFEQEKQRPKYTMNEEDIL